MANTARSVIYREMTLGFEYTDQEIIDAVTDKNDIARKAWAFKRKNLLNDRFKLELESVLSGMFVEISYKEIKKYVDASQNLFRRVIKETSLVYQREPERMTDPEAAMERYDEIVQDSHLDLAMSRANFLLNGLNDLILMPLVLGQGLSLGIITPDQVTLMVNENDPTLVEALIIEEQKFDYNAQTQSIYTFWSPTRHFQFKEDKGGTGTRASYSKISVNEGDVNPYAAENLKDKAFYPFVFCHASHRENSFWDIDTNTSLYEGTILLGIQNTFKNFMIPQQFKQLAVKMSTKGDGGWINDQVSNPLHIFQTNGDMVVLDWQSAIDKLDVVIQNKVSQIANDYGISAEQMKLEATAQSGFSRLVAKERIYELRDEQIKFWRIYEREVFDAFRVANNLYLTTDFQTSRPSGVTAIPDIKSFSVDFAEPKMLIDPMEDLDVKEKKIEMGLLSPVDLIMAENPDITDREEALKKLQENLADKALVTASGAQFATPSLNSFGAPGGADTGAGKPGSMAKTKPQSGIGA